MEIKVPMRGVFQYLMIISGILRAGGKSLTRTEVEVLAAFIEVKQEIDASGLKISPFSTEMKKKAAKKLGREDFNTLNNYIKSMKDKGILIPREDGYQILPYLIPPKDNRLVIHFKNN